MFIASSVSLGTIQKQWCMAVLNAAMSHNKKTERCKSLLCMHQKGKLLFMRTCMYVSILHAVTTEFLEPESFACT